MSASDETIFIGTSYEVPPMYNREQNREETGVLSYVGGVYSYINDKVHCGLSNVNMSVSKLRSWLGFSVSEDSRKLKRLEDGY